MREYLGLIHIYTGEGKGKTTAAMGLAMRARGTGLSVLVAQLFKSKSGEINMLKKLGIDYIAYSSTHPLFKKYSKDELEQEADKCYVFVKHAFMLAQEKEFDMLILDEIGPALAYHLIKPSDLVELIVNKPKHTELVMTGRGFPEEILKLAPPKYLTRMECKQHPFDNGIKAREGIEY